MTTGHFE